MLHSSKTNDHIQFQNAKINIFIVKGYRFHLRDNTDPDSKTLLGDIKYNVTVEKCKGPGVGSKH